MEEKLKNELREDEKLLWWGKPEKFTFLDTTYKSAFIKKLSISLGIVAALIIAYICAASAQNFKPAVVVVLLAAGLIGPGNMIMDANKLQKKMTYAVTDKRLIQVLDSVKGVEYAAIERVQFKTDSDGHSSLVCGTEGEKARETKWRELTVVGARMDEDCKNCESFVMYAVPDAEKLKKILAPFVAVE